MNNKNTPHIGIVYANSTIVLNVVRIFIEQKSNISVIERNKKSATKLYKDYTQYDNFRLILKPNFEAIEQSGHSFDYLILFVDQYLQGGYYITSDTYLSILEDINNGISKLTHNKSKILIVLPANAYTTHKKSEYTIGDLNTAINKLVSEKKKSIKIAYSGEVLGYGIALHNKTPCQKLLLESIRSTILTIPNDGLESYYFVHINDYTYGIIDALFGNSRYSLIAIPNKISLLSLAYKIVGLNPNVTDIAFEQQSTKQPKYEPLHQIRYRSIETRFSFEETIEKTIHYIYEVNNLQIPQEKDPKPTRKPKLKVDVEEEYTIIGKILHKSKKLYNKSLKPAIKYINDTLRYSIKKYTATPQQKAKLIIVLLTLILVAYFVLLPITGIFISLYGYTKSLKMYITAIYDLNYETLEKYDYDINKSNETLQQSYATMSWMQHIPYLNTYYADFSPTFNVLDNTADSIKLATVQIKPLLQYLNNVTNGKTQSNTIIIQEMVNNNQYTPLLTDAIIRTLAAIQQVKPYTIPSRYRQLLHSIQDNTVNTDVITELSILWQELPYLLGYGDCKSYLFLLTNPYEIRTQGGWISGYAILRIENGDFKKLEFNNIYELDGAIKKLTTPLPVDDEMKRLFGTNAVLLASNMNYVINYPDIITVSEKTLQSTNMTGKVDAVISIDLFTLERLLELTGPIQLDSTGTTISSDNILQSIVYYHDSFSPEDDNKPLILTELAQKVLDRIVNKQVNYSDLISILLDSLDSKDILITTRNSNIEQIITKYKWNSKIDSYSEYIAISEWNTGGNKANAFVSKNININPVNNVYNLTIDYTNNSQNNDYPEGDYAIILRLVFPASYIINKVSGTENYTIYKVGNRIEIIGTTTVKTQSHHKVEIEFAGSDSLILVKQPGIINTTVYTKGNSIDFIRDISLNW